MAAMAAPPVDARALELERARDHLALARAARALPSGVACVSLAVGGAGVVYAWPGAPFNQALGLGWSGEPAAAELAAVEAFFRPHGEACVIDLSDQAPTVWRDLLASRGYRLRESLYLWVRTLTDADLEERDPRVEHVVDEGGRADWARAVARGFAHGAPLAVRDLDVARAIATTDGAELFLARDADGRPAAGGALQLHADVASLYAAATTPAARRQGLQRALIGARLAFARARGARVATVQTDPTGPSRRNAERLGFAVAYTTWSLVSPPW